MQFCIVSNGYETKYFPNHYGKEMAKSFYPHDANKLKPLKTFPNLDSTIFGMLSNLLDLVENFVFVKRYRDFYTKIIARWMQFKATNEIFNRVATEKRKKRGLIWHWQGSGKTFLSSEDDEKWQAAGMHGSKGNELITKSSDLLVPSNL